MTVETRPHLQVDVPAAAAPSALQPAVKQGTFHLIGHAHIDPVWLWRWQEGFQEIHQTWRSALDRMREYPEFHFSASSAAFYEWIERADPAMFDEICGRVAEGRWEPVAGWWVEPDCNIPSGESMVRHGLYGQRFYATRFGHATRVGFNPDAFGHAAGIPQILARSGLSFYAFLRPQAHERPLPRMFRWRAADGSEVLCFRIVHEYGSWTPELERWIRRCVPELADRNDRLMVFYGVGNHGGGPTRANLESLRSLDVVDELPALERSTMETFFRNVEQDADEMPLMTGELQPHAPGCYSTNSGVKRWNRRAESLLPVAERWSVVAGRIADRHYPHDELTQAWKDVLFNQFHDILAGTAIEPAYDDARDLNGRAMAAAASALNDATQAIARRIDTSAFEHTSRPIVVFNPHAWPMVTSVEMEIGGVPALADGRPRDTLLDDSGTEVPHQLVRSDATVTGGRTRLSFAADVPAFGYRVYRVVARTPLQSFPACDATDTTLDNGRLRLEIDAATGCFARLLDRRTGAQLFSGEGGAVGYVLYDGYDTWGHGLVGWDRIAGRFEALSARLVEHGPVKSVIRIVSRYGSSTLTQDVELCPTSERIDVRCELDWHERQRVLKLRFPLDLADPVATFEAAYAEIERPPDGHEVPTQRWADVSGFTSQGGRAGLTLLNDGKHGCDVLGANLGMTVVRSPLYAHHEPYLVAADERGTWQDQGMQRFRYALVPHAGDHLAAGVRRHAAELNQSPITLAETFHAGTLPLQASFASVEPANVELVALKAWEDGPDEAAVIRLFETGGTRTTAVVQLPLLDRLLTIEIGAWELRTFIVPHDRTQPVREATLVEWPLETSPMTADGPHATVPA